jgi:hypothetical protein
MEVMKMTRFMKFSVLAGLSAGYLLQLGCGFAGHGFSLIPNGLIPNPFAGLFAGLLGT